MSALFIVAALLQYNDPDPVRWMVIYAAAAVVSGYAAQRGAVPPAVPVAVAAVALVWGLIWSTDVGGLATYERMFDSWEMRNAAVEEARETSGLMIVTGWMLLLAVHSWRGRRRGPQQH